jgi:hypothetical protein
LRTALAPGVTVGGAAFRTEVRCHGLSPRLSLQSFERLVSVPRSRPPPRLPPAANTQSPSATFGGGALGRLAR